MGNHPNLRRYPPVAFSPKTHRVSPIQVQATPIFALSPMFGFLWVLPFGVAVCPVEHPAIQFVKDFTSNHRPKVIRPPPDDRIESCQESLDVGSLSFHPDVLEFLLDGLY